MDIMEKSFPEKLKECYGKTLFKKSLVFLNPNVVWDLDNLYYKSWYPYGPMFVSSC